MQFGGIDYAILIIYLAAMVGIGFLFAGKQKTAEDFFMAGRKMPWLAVAMSMYASLTSAVTYMGLPGLAYRSNVTLLAVAVVSPLLAPILILVFYPVYRKLNITTSYEYIGIRFGEAARKTAAALFLIARLGWMATVIYAPALALSIATGLPLLFSILTMGLLATLYTVMGGLAAVLWTDVVQGVLMLLGFAGWYVWNSRMVADNPPPRSRRPRARLLPPLPPRESSRPRRRTSPSAQPSPDLARGSMRLCAIAKFSGAVCDSAV